MRAIVRAPCIVVFFSPFSNFFFFDEQVFLCHVIWWKVLVKWNSYCVYRWWCCHRTISAIKNWFFLSWTNKHSYSIFCLLRISLNWEKECMEKLNFLPWKMLFFANEHTYKFFYGTGIETNLDSSINMLGYPACLLCLRKNSYKIFLLFFFLSFRQHKTK